MRQATDKDFPQLRVYLLVGQECLLGNVRHLDLTRGLGSLERHAVEVLIHLLVLHILCGLLLLILLVQS